MAGTGRDLYAQYRSRILSLLISKYEGSRSFQTGIPGKQRPQFTMKKSPLAGDYFDEMDHRKREAIHAVLAELASAGVIEVTWPRFQEGRQVEKVYLNFDAIPRAYELAGLVPRAEQLRRLRQVLAPLASHPWEWVRRWWAGVDAALARRRAAGLDLEDLEGYGELVKVLLALPELDDIIPERIFSQRVLGDSKAFEQRVKKRLLALLKRYGPEEYETDEEYLDSVGLTDNPKMVLVAGPFIIRVGKTTVDMGELPGGLGLAAHTVRAMEITAVAARWVLLVENLTSYYQVVQGGSEGAVPCRERGGGRGLAVEGPEWAAEDQEKTVAPPCFPGTVGSADTPAGETWRRPAGLVVYTGGFPHRGVQLFLRKLQDYRESPGATARPPVYHWGDMDYGGIRICEYIRRNLIPDLQPYLMDVTTYTRYLPVGIPFGDEYAARLRHLSEDPAYAPWHPLLQAMLKHHKWVEQESMGPGATPPVLPP